MEKEKILSNIFDGGIVAVIRAESEYAAEKVTEACVEGGVKAVELTFTVPHANNVIEALARRYEGTDVLVGAGTVTDAITARVALLSGAQYIVSPFFDVETVKLCNRERVPMIPGIMTIREAVMAMEAGADCLKVFPAEVCGKQFIKAVLGPLPKAKLLPTGGVTADNCGEWLRAGAVAVGAGGALTSGAESGDYKKVTETAKRFTANIAAARNGS